MHIQFSLIRESNGQVSLYAHTNKRANDRIYTGNDANAQIARSCFVAGVAATGGTVSSCTPDFEWKHERGDYTVPASIDLA
jgi:hypothetical protein